MPRFRKQRRHCRKIAADKRITARSARATAFLCEIALSLLSMLPLPSRCSNIPATCQSTRKRDSIRDSAGSDSPPTNAKNKYGDDDMEAEQDQRIAEAEAKIDSTFAVERKKPASKRVFIDFQDALCNFFYICTEIEQIPITEDYTLITGSVLDFTVSKFEDIANLFGLLGSKMLNKGQKWWPRVVEGGFGGTIQFRSAEAARECLDRRDLVDANGRKILRKPIAGDEEFKPNGTKFLSVRNTPPLILHKDSDRLMKGLLRCLNVAKKTFHEGVLTLEFKKESDAALAGYALDRLTCFGTRLVVKADRA